MANLHDTALAAEKNCEQLATGLAEAGADPKTVTAVSEMAETLRKIVSALGAGQEETGDNEPPANPHNEIGQAAAEMHEMTAAPR